MSEGRYGGGDRYGGGGRPSPYDRNVDRFGGPGQMRHGGHMRRRGKSRIFSIALTYSMQIFEIQRIPTCEVGTGEMVAGHQGTWIRATSDHARLKPCTEMKGPDIEFICVDYPSGQLKMILLK